MISAPVGKKPNVPDFPLRAVSKFFTISPIEPIRLSESLLFFLYLAGRHKEPTEVP
jgi:hypothetical protein